MMESLETDDEGEKAISSLGEESSRKEDCMDGIEGKGRSERQDEIVEVKNGKIVS